MIGKWTFPRPARRLPKIVLKDTTTVNLTMTDLGTLREIFTRAGIKTRLETDYQEGRAVLSIGNAAYTINGPDSFPCGSVDFTFDIHGTLLSGQASE